MGALQQQIRSQEQEMSLLKQQGQELQERLRKDSHNSHLPHLRIASSGSRGAYARKVERKQVHRQSIRGTHGTCQRHRMR